MYHYYITILSYYTTHTFLLPYMAKVVNHLCMLSTPPVRWAAQFCWSLCESKTSVLGLSLLYVLCEISKCYVLFQLYARQPSSKATTTIISFCMPYYVGDINVVSLVPQSSIAILYFWYIRQPTSLWIKWWGIYSCYSMISFSAIQTSILRMSYVILLFTAVSVSVDPIK